MRRFRLRFLLQEFDLLGAEVLVGRSPECQVTVEDPLVSRQHARFVVDGEHVWIEDLGSRNGVRVNGVRISDRTEVVDGDRIRIGTQELVLAAQARRKPIRTTGVMRVCSHCEVAFPEVSRHCPHCGAENDDEAALGFDAQKQRDWTFHLLEEVIERALSTGRLAEADRMLRRAAGEVEELLNNGDKLADEQVSQMALFALRLADQLQGGEWVRWAVQLHQRLAVPPSESVLSALEAVTETLRRDARDAFEALAEWLTAHSGHDTEHLARLRRLSDAPPAG